MKLLKYIAKSGQLYVKLYVKLHVVGLGEVMPAPRSRYFHVDFGV